MGNYFEGNIRFSIKPDATEFVNALVDFTRYRLDNDDDYELIDEYIATHTDIFTEGIRIWKRKYGDFRNFNEISLCNQALGADLSDFDYDMSDLEDIIQTMDEEERFKTPYSFDDICKFFRDEYYKEDYYPTERLWIDISVSVCEKYNGDADLIKLIDLWSPYMLEDIDCLGTISDEDHTFCKDYFRYNKSKIEHYSFCGDWCSEYFPESSCQRKHCEYIFNLGVQEGMRME